MSTVVPPWIEPYSNSLARRVKFHETSSHQVADGPGQWLTYLLDKGKAPPTTQTTHKGATINKQTARVESRGG